MLLFRGTIVTLLDLCEILTLRVVKKYEQSCIHYEIDYEHILSLSDPPTSTK
jgi:hypothetical protein